MPSQVTKNLIITSVLVILFSNTHYGQSPVKQYEKEWKTVNGFIEKNLPASALAAVKNIYALAKREKQDAQVIKSLVFTMNLQSETRENNLEKSIKEIEQELADSRQPASSILYGMLAGIYLDYYNSIRWQLYGRSQTTGFEKTDPATWTSEDFHQKIAGLYLLSLKDEKLLQQTRLEKYEAIIVQGNMRHLRPTLYDLLANNALAYFMNDERDIKKPAFAFEIAQAAAFDPAADFIHRKFETKDTTSLQFMALLLYQRLIAFHLSDTRPDALIDADLQRLEFVKDKSVHPDKDQLYFNAINHVAQQYENLPVAAQAWYLVARYYEDRAQTYKPGADTTYRFERVKAKDICQKIIAQKDSSEGKINCLNLFRAITAPELDFKVEKVNIPDQPFRILAVHRNIPGLYLRIIPIDENLRKLLRERDEEKYWPAIFAARPIRTWLQTLPGSNDLQQHSVELKVDALPAGDYMLVASPGAGLSARSALVGAARFFVSGISYVNTDNHYFVLDRDKGYPLANASIQVWVSRYNYNTGKTTREKESTYRTDQNGYFALAVKNTKNEYGSYWLDISYGRDRLFIEDEVERTFFYRPEKQNQPTLNADIEINNRTTTFLYTDRSIYRPGQTVYFKGISICDESPRHAVVRYPFRTKVFFRNANYQLIDSLDVETNEYGSFSGRFQLPTGTLNGGFTISVSPGKGYHQIQVEEYKRPSFQAEFEPVKETYMAGDTIHVTGTAKAYAGNNIDGASVKFRVVRTPRFIYPWMFYKWWQPPVAPMEIAHGETTTDRDGKFKLAFTAIPDRSIQRKFDPVFDYDVYADITDINGETRSAQKRISAAYKSILLKVNLDELIPADSFRAIDVRAENMNGEFQPSVLIVAIARLTNQERLIRTRYWDRPDQYVMSRDEFLRYFPNDEYSNEADIHNWEKAETVYTKSDSLKKNKPFSIENAMLKPGFYSVEITTKDSRGEDVREIRYIELFDKKSKQLSRPEYLWTRGAAPVEPGQTANLTLGTGSENLHIIQMEVKPGGQEATETPAFTFFNLNNEKRIIGFPATEADRGGYGVAFVSVKNNRVYRYGQTIQIPWSNKDLSIEYSSFRDRTLPGSEEKWTVSLKGPKKEKVAAEMLAGMYDASLDQFYSHQWQVPSVWPDYTMRLTWNESINFSPVDAELKPLEKTEEKYIDKQYDQLITIGNNGDDYLSFGLLGNVQMRRFTSPKVVSDMVVMEQKAVADSATFMVGRIDNPPAAKGELQAYKISLNELSGQAGKAGDTGPGVQIRKNFNETAFFFPQLQTDTAGNIRFSFTMPEALTRWKFEALAHTRELAFGYSSKEIVTQKKLMVQPNATRFVRQGDKLVFSTKVVNLTDSALTGDAELQLMDAATNEPVNDAFRNLAGIQHFTVPGGQSIAVKFPVEVPAGFNSALVWRIVARAPGVSDGEENVVPVLSNRILVTETMPVAMQGAGSRQFSFDKLLKSGNSNSLEHQSVTVEYTSNPAWFAVQSLPYLNEYPYDCAEQTWNRYFANSLAAMIANSSPRIRQVFERWRIKDSAALMSNLEKNEELKSVLLEETPWVLQAGKESGQKKNIALLFDMITMSDRLSSTYQKLVQMQSPNGGFVWFKGGPDDRYITQYIVSGIGHLKKLNGIANGQQSPLNDVLAKAIPYLDAAMKKDYDELVKSKTDLAKYSPGYSTVQYLYMRSFFPDRKIPAAAMNAYSYFRGRSQKTWNQQNKYMQGMLALALYRTGDINTPAAILKSLSETAIKNEEMGMYWKTSARSWWWYESEIERQSLLIEAFREIGRDTKTVDALRTWLLKNKQTNDWGTTRATAEACYALLIEGTGWIFSNPSVQISLGNFRIDSDTLAAKEEGTGYFKRVISAAEVSPSMGNISVLVKPAPMDTTIGASWGSVYWQYFEDIDKITGAATPLSLGKKLFIETNTDRGPVLTPINNGDQLTVGDRIKVRIELRVDRDMDYVHMKDMRAAGVEPTNVLSGYRWQGGLDYYETTKDASTDFFFSSLRKGTYVFEYPVTVTHTGDFSNGITTIQCMYAPEFSTHSEGIRITVK